jgi:hypothetical protein
MSGDALSCAFAQAVCELLRQRLHACLGSGAGRSERPLHKPLCLLVVEPDPTHVQGACNSYVLVDEPDGHRVFVPEDDQCLRAAFLSSSGEPGSYQTETLAGEIARRKLEI